MSKSWNPSYLFIATFKGFYFDEINIIKNNGEIPTFHYNQIAEDVQKRYLQIL